MDNLDLHHEIERLCSELREANDSIARKDEEVVAAETKFHEDNVRLSTELSKLRERYERLLSNHQHLSKLNHELEAKLLQTIENTTVEKKAMTDEVEAMNTRLAEAELQLSLVKAERDRYKEDCAIAVSLLQANPDKFYPQSFQPLSSTGNGRTCPGNDYMQPSTGHFPTFLPTFPPIDLSSMIPLKSAPIAPKPSSDQQPRESFSSSTTNRLGQFSSGSGYLRTKGSAVTHL
ncbi:NAD-dependent deacetylase sirtuin 4 [Fasciola gigantica]|uniref:NAD-dependent deacetylase sirtuin 4 n=1 Tax=Fasciola gigantica TaxID=46835 RepID=A0A504YJA6_FASGI|nr:NAD-dependent deacetylase sirtuin 4 [Fasciola gigantica]